MDSDELSEDYMKDFTEKKEVLNQFLGTFDKVSQRDSESGDEEYEDGLAVNPKDVELFKRFGLLDPQ